VDEAVAGRARVVAAALIRPLAQFYEARAVRVARREVPIIRIGTEHSLGLPKLNQARRLKLRRCLEDIDARVLEALPLPQKTGKECAPTYL
jgi:hypothetical protein